MKEKRLKVTYNNHIYTMDDIYNFKDELRNKIFELAGIIYLGSLPESLDEATMTIDLIYDEFHEVYDFDFITISLNLDDSQDIRLQASNLYARLYEMFYDSEDFCDVYLNSDFSITLDLVKERELYPEINLFSYLEQ